MAYTRLTVIGPSRKADLVLPDDEPVGSLLPQLLTILGERFPGGQELALSTLTGRALDLGAPLGKQEIQHGSILRLTALDEAPTAPEVADVTDSIAATRSGLPDLWTRLAAIVVGAVTTGVLTFIGAGLIVPNHATMNLPNVQAAIGVGAVLVTAAALLASQGQAAAAHFAAAGLGVLLPVTWSMSLALPLRLLVLNLAATIWLVAGVVIGGGLRRRSVSAGAVIATLAAGLLLLAYRLGWPNYTVAVITALIGLVIIGLLPGVALALSGLTRYDDQSVQGERPQLTAVAQAILEGFSTLTCTVLAVALPTGFALVDLATSNDPWAVPLAIVSSLALLLRARLMPLIPQRVALFLAGGAALLAVLLTWAPITPAHRIVALATVIMMLLATSLARPNEVLSARGRRLCQLAETLLLVATVPLALGSLGIYADLLEVFR